MPVIGYLSAAGESAQRPRSAAFRQGLGEQGFVEGRNVEILYLYADTRYDRLPALAAELVRRRVDVIAAVGSPASPLAAKGATPTIPTVFVLGTDPVDCWARRKPQSAGRQRHRRELPHHIASTSERN
jgi:putative ABC transport system substrate-binding protein